MDIAISIKEKKRPSDDRFVSIFTFSCISFTPPAPNRCCEKRNSLSSYIVEGHLINNIFYPEYHHIGF